MYNKSDKRRLYWLIEQYLLGKINSSTFCLEFYLSYDLEISEQSLSELEKEIFQQISNIVDRYSDSSEDLKTYPKYYISEEELKNTIEKAKEILSPKNLCPLMNISKRW